ncbi:interleukin-4 receptor subunit alpha [Microcaecilia unicolor]|uniref:Interleukin-4 receptor subunit alpha n=1 Tax=Microcaecilia unicolor TaxID=1415580 RepID=A0A6P7YUV3_9AMPH|nr:interleukin-4 receptor subunit alpha [Microcaecilia unicolor]XP_030068751.1 interleukin-4 receptor subunit alpha [Microcaecilia unicolor]XP_030068752.1 interleukin-4 receptor subunit alpha [Microcaecilia unicolor]XP_030068753.1 interleukin-4 receptor subunit alpha [Microcaecilia unicolor]
MSLFWLLLLSCGFQLVTTDGQVKNLECYNDYDREMVCLWEVEDLTSCRDQYLLTYERLNNPQPNKTCIPENVKVEDYISFSKCTCSIFVPYFIVTDEYNIEILYNKTVVLNETVIPSDTVKPKPPKNLTVTKNENGNFLLRWDKSYKKSNLLYNRLGFEITYYEKRNPEKIHTKMINNLETSYEILMRELDPGDYVAKVRSMPKEYEGQPSEWSSVAEWRKESESSPPIPLWINVPIFSIVIVVLAVICYYCCDKYKEEWWNNIPDPAKSSFAVKNFNVFQSSGLRKKQCVCDQKTSSHDTILKHMRKNFGSWISKRIPFSLGKNCWHEGYTHEVVKCKEDKCKIGDQRAAIPEEAGRILIPEQTLVKSLEIYPLEPDTALPFEEDCEKLEDKDAEEANINSIFPFDPCIQDLFLNIIGTKTWQTNSDFIEDKYKFCNSHETENTNQEIYRDSDQLLCSKHLPFFTDNGSLEKNYRKHFVQSVKPVESSHHGCKSETEEDLVKFMLDSQGLSDLEAFRDGLGGVTHESNMCFDADYRSFDSTLSRSKDNAIHVECCPTNMESDLFSSQDGEGLSFLKPTRGLHEITYPKVNNCVSSTNCTILSMPGYQSFDNAVKQAEMQDDQTVNCGSPNETIPEESGCKPFDCASIQSTYTERGIGTPDLSPGRDRECDCSDSLSHVYFNETYEKNEKNDEIGDSQSSSMNSGGQHCNDTGSIYNPLNGRTLDRNSNVVHALTFDICDHLKNFGNSSPGDPLLNKEGNSLDCLHKLTDNPNLRLLQQKKSSEAVMLNCGQFTPSVDFPPFQKRHLPFLKCPTKFENISYFIQPCSSERMLGLEHDKVLPLDEGNGVKHYLMGLKEEEDGEGNFYMEVTTRMDL